MTLNGGLAMRNTNVKPGELYLFEFWYQNNKRREPYGKIRPVLIMEVKKDKLLLAQVTSQYDKKSDYIKLQYSPIKDWEEAQLLKPSWIDMGQNSLRFVNRHKANLKKIGSLTPEDILRAVNYWHHHKEWQQKFIKEHPQPKEPTRNKQKEGPKHGR
ncbi:type II toxin-antitoxin system PemK/MazF family toxin [Limosilactobacillus fermentum]|nr:type II toxin-antitoxin system PemK/MazF family toxin [Limosilactobacillus fermentum]